MFRWRKRDEGFEWQQYVRTTIKLRREARREKAHKLGEQAAVGARKAGEAAAVGARKAGEAAAVGARKAGEAAAVGARKAGQAAGVAANAGASRLAAGAKAAAERGGDIAVALIGLAGLAAGRAARWLAAKLAPLIDVLGRPGVAGPLLLAGTIATLAGLGRLWLAGKGLDTEATGALSIGIACLILGLGPALWLGHSRLLGDLGPFFKGFSLKPMARLGPRAYAAIALAVVVVGGAAAVGSMRPAGLGISLPSVSNLPALPFAAPVVVEGRARAIAGDRLRIGDATVVLQGIEAPEPQQRCESKSGRSWRCGSSARDALARLVRGRKTVRCETGKPDTDGVSTGRCTIGEDDLAAALVRAGHVFAETGLVPRYASEQAEARKQGDGLWVVDEPERPATWRQRLWAEAKTKAPDGCPIKGQVSRGKRIYLLPWSSRYTRVRVNQRRGERWFCSEDEAIAAGWRSDPRG